MGFGGMHPYPRRVGGGRSLVQLVLDGLNADRGTAFDATNRETTVYVNNMAIARAIAAARSTNSRLGNMWVPARMSADVLARWERILALNPSPTDTEASRRVRLEAVFSGFGKETISGRIGELLAAELGDVFIAVENISYDNAQIVVPDGSYPWGSAGAVPWSSTVAHILVRLQKPDGCSEAQFYAAAARVGVVLEPIVPAWVTFDWYRPGPTYESVTGGPSAGGFYLDDEHNLDNEVLLDSYSVFDPATLALTGWWRGSFSASPWVGNASAGTSATHDLTEATNPPSVGAAVAGYTPADFDGSNDLLENASTCDNFLSNTAYSGSALVYVDSIATNATPAIYDNDQIVNTQGIAYWGIYLRSGSGGLVGIFHYDGSYHTAEAAFTAAQWNLVQYDYDGATIRIRVNGGTWQTASAGTLHAGFAARTFQIGRNTSSTEFLDGKYLDLMTSQSKFTDDTHDDILSYCRTRYGLALT